MHSLVRPVAIGLILGLLSLIFGIFWAAYITVRHDSIHRALKESGDAALSAKFVQGGQGVGHEGPFAPAEGPGHDIKQGAEGGHGHDHALAKGHSHSVSAEPLPKAAQSVAKDSHSMHDDPNTEAAHERLTRGHIHAMGLGLLTIAVSFILAFLSAPARAKTFASASAGVGGLFYPLAWIIMGYRTTAMGPSASADSVFPVVAFSVPLVLIGIFVTLYYVLKNVFGRV